MKKGGKGGGNTTTGLNFEKERDILKLLSLKKGYDVKDNVVYFKNEEVAKSYKKYDFYRFLESKNIDYNALLSKRLVPDEALYVIIKNTMFIIEMKFQEVQGSVDEKLQTADFKKKQYEKLLTPLKIKAEFIYLLGDWFLNKKYADSLDYIKLVGCDYYFREIPISKFGLPIPK